MALTAKKVYAILNKKIQAVSGDVSNIPNPLVFRGSIATADLLPSAPKVGDMYNIESKSIYGESGMNVAWTGDAWDPLGPTIDMSLYETAEQANEKYATKEEIPTELPASDVPDWAKQPNKPTYTAEEIGALPADTVISLTKEEKDQIEINRQNILKNTIKRSASGNPIQITDSADMPFVEMKQYGWSTQETTTGAQLFDIDNPVLGANNAYELSNNRVKIENGLIYSGGVIGIASGTYLMIPSNGIDTIYISFNNIGDSVNGDIIACLDISEDKIIVGKQVIETFTGVKGEKTQTIKVSSGIAYVGIAFYAANQYGGIIKDLMISVVPTPWEPYTGGKPSPSPEYPQPIVSAGDKGSIDTKVMGKNIFRLEGRESIGDTGLNCNGYTIQNMSESAYSKINNYRNCSVTFDDFTRNLFTISSTLDNPNGCGVELPVKVIPNTTYCLSFKANNSAMVCQLFEFDSSIKKIRENVTIRNGSLINTSSNAEWVVLKFSSIARTTYSITDVQLEISSAPTPYEPYRPVQTFAVATPNGLPGIPVTSGGNYTDETGQRWICDEIDWERGIYVQRVKKYEVTGNEDYFYGDSKCFEGSSTCMYFNLNDSRMNSVNHKLPCNKLLHVINVWSITDGSIGVCGNYAQIHMRLSNNMIGVQDSDEKKVKIQKYIEYIKAQYDNGDPFIVQYILTTPIETPIPPEELAAYHVLHTNYPSTVISNDEDCWTDVEYARNTEDVIDEKAQGGNIITDAEGKKYILKMKDGILTVFEVID